MSSVDVIPIKAIIDDQLSVSVNNQPISVSVSSALPSGSNTIGNVNVNGSTSSNGTVQAGSISVSTTAIALNSDTNLVEALTLYAPSSNTATINVGNSSTQAFPLLAGSSLTLRKVKPSNVYLVSTSGTQTVYYVYGE